MARVTGDRQTCASLTSHLLDIRQTGRDIMSVNVSHKADVLLTNLANGHDTLPLHAEQLFWHSRIYVYLYFKKKKVQNKLDTFGQ